MISNRLQSADAVPPNSHPAASSRGSVNGLTRSFRGAIQPGARGRHTPDEQAETHAYAGDRVPTKQRLDYLDGIRGVTALLILLTHVAWEVFPKGQFKGVAPWLGLILHPFEFSNKVAIFIVLSGYCIALPLVRTGRLQIDGGAVGFLRRRARKILPPYYAALGLFLAVIAVVPSLGHFADTRWDVALPSLDPAVIVSHLLLVHNVSPDWNLRIDPPMWSLAIEWQMYFLFVLILLPVWRRRGLIAAILLGSCLGYAPHVLLPASSNFDWTSPWYLCLFCLGLGAAATWHAPAKTYRPALCGAALFGAIVVGFIGAGSSWCAERHPLIDFCVGVFTACFLAYGTSAVHLKRPSAALRCLGSRIPLWLGSLSYSLYLVHFPILSWLHHEFRKPLGVASEDPATMLALLYGLGVPLCIAAAVGFRAAVGRLGQLAFRDDRERRTSARRAA